MDGNIGIALSDVDSIKFTIKTNKQQLKGSAVSVKSPIPFIQGGKPHEGSIADLRFGSLESKYTCETCENNEIICPKHYGIIDLKYPMYDPKPLMINELCMWAKFTCFVCGSPIVDLEHIPEFHLISNSAKVGWAAAEVHVGYPSIAKKPDLYQKIPVHCGMRHPIVYINKADRKSIVMRCFTDSHPTMPSDEMYVYPHILLQIMQKVSDRTIRLLGRNPETYHPANFIRTQIQVPPLNITSVSILSNQRQGKGSNGGLFQMLNMLVKYNGRMSEPLPVESFENMMQAKLVSTAIPKKRYNASAGITSDDSDATKEQNELRSKYIERLTAARIYNMMLIGASGVPKQISDVSLMDDLTGKQGLLRQDLMASRLHNRGRAVIYNAPWLKLEEVCLPQEMCIKLKMPEKVTKYNYKQLYMYFKNGPQYPGCSELEKSNGTTYVIDAKTKQGAFVLEIGDTLWRHLINGDHVAFNRQPSLSTASLELHKVVVNPDSTIKGIGMNIEICAGYNADFDGDQMLVVPIQNVSTRAECITLNRVPTFFINEQTQSPRWGLSQDSIVLIAELSRSTTILTDLEARRIFENVDCDIVFGISSKKNQKRTSHLGRELISMVLPIIDYSGTPAIAKFAKEHNMIEILGLATDELKVKIENGVFIEGILDKAIIGPKEGSLFHEVYNRYDVDETVKLIFNLQQVALNYGRLRGFSISASDFYIDDAAQLEIDERIRAVQIEGNIIENNLYEGKIKAPKGMTVSQYYEEMNLGVLKGEYLDIILKSLGPESNLVKMVMYGSGGNPTNLDQMCGSVGQVLVAGERPPQKFNIKRSSIFTQSYDMSPTARGFIPMSFIRGLPLSSYFELSKESRYNMIVKAIQTAKAGYMGRMLTRNLESDICDYLGLIIKDKKIIQFAYGENGYDPKMLIKCKIPSIDCTDVEFDEKFGDSYLVKVLNDNTKLAPQIKKIFEDEAKQIKTDRKNYFESMFNLEKISGSQMFKSEQSFCVNVVKLIKNSRLDSSIESKHDSKHDSSIESGLDSKHESSIESKYDSKYEKLSNLLPEKIQYVKDFIERLPFYAFNDNVFNDAALKSKLPQYIFDQYEFFCIYLRSALHSSVLKNLTKQYLKQICDIILAKFVKSLLQPGTPIGIINAVGISEPTTQRQLDSHHYAGADRVAKYTLNDISDFLKAVDTSKTGTAMMYIRIKPEFERDKLKAKEIANKIQISILNEYVTTGAIFFEYLGEISHPDYVVEKQIYESFKKRSTLGVKAHDFHPFCFRFELSSVKMMEKNITVEEIVRKLYVIYSNIFIVYTFETDKQFGPILRIHLKAKDFKLPSPTYLEHLIEIKQNFEKTIIRGVKGIRQAIPTQQPITKIDATGETVQDIVWVIRTRGSNMTGILAIPEIIPELAQTSSIIETQNVLGLSAAKTKITVEFNKIIDGINPQFFTLVAAEMTSTGTITGISRYGNLKRDPQNVLLNMCIGYVPFTLANATLNSATTSLHGLSARMCLGLPPKLGTGYPKCIYDSGMIADNADKFMQDDVNQLIETL